ncbi:hypothetical protein BVY01_02785 [bacterium I07]|nr:hypothetical protein BVY01_02785 [bacterium I07]
MDLNWDLILNRKNLNKRLKYTVEDNMKFPKTVLKWPAAAFLLSLVAVLILAPGCEELLNEALTKDIVVEDTVIEEQTITATEEVLPLVQSPQKLSKSDGVQQQRLQLDAEHHFTTSHTVPDLFTWVLWAGGGQLHMEFENTFPGIANVHAYLEHLIAPFTTTTVNNYDLPFSGSETAGDPANTIYEYFENSSGYSSHFTDFVNTGVDAFDVVLATSGDLADPLDPRGLYANTVEFLVQASQKISRTIPQNDDLAAYADKVEDISEIELSGQIQNNGTADVIMRFMLLPGAPVAHDFTGVVLQTTLAPGGSFDFAAWKTYYTEAEQAQVLGAFADAVSFLGVGPIVSKMYFTSSADLNVYIPPILLSSTATVAL